MDILIPLKKEQDFSYTVSIGDLPEITLDKKVMIVTNPTVGDLHLETLKKHIHANELYTVMVPDGEDYKNMQSIDLILDACFEKRLDRKSVMISLGGGVIGDMTGFASSLYQRGIDFIQVPTTLLSQVDASVGGKTGINNKYGKNLMGAFHQPKAVYIDPQFLKTLPKREYAAGIAEIVKMAVTFDKEFFDFLENADLNNDKDILEAIKRSVQLKANVVAQDEKEQGIR
ncbi:MAG: 3-dehydroquinate synthase, partial [Thiovulaceae bacterium]|nr:3-dehydroquinate synthase [Sulfurimonadaceae bacterium]